MDIQELHNTIKDKLRTRTTDQLIEDAKFARASKHRVQYRMIFALTMDVIEERITEAAFDTLYEEMILIKPLIEVKP